MKPLTRDQAKEIKAFILGSLSYFCKDDTWIRQQRRLAIRTWLNERVERPDPPRKRAPKTPAAKQTPTRKEIHIFW